MDNNGLFTGVSGERRVRNVMGGGEPLDPDKTYSLAGQDYLIISISWPGSFRSA